ncbi:MAG TPA: permease prefix domain 1-containing protein [Egibacteraceae bacterium]|nr:permease prefix domain 1-containing protein [Egibacteraceae bacterium]
MESQIAEWRAYVAKAPAVNGRDVDELEAHLRDQIAELDAAGLTADEGFLVAVKRMGDLDTLSREFAREHSGRLWKQLVLSGEDEPARPASGWVQALGFAVAAAVSVQVARLAAGVPEEEPPVWLLRNLGLFVLPFLAGYFARRRQLDTPGWLRTVAPFVLVALVVNLYPFRAGSVTEVLVALHLPVVLWFAVAYPYMGGTLRSHERRMDFVRFTGEWLIYYALIALGGGVLLGLTAAILDPIGPDLAERVVEWVLPSGAAGAVIVAAWLVESKQQVVENMAPVLTMIFTPLFAVMLTVAAATYAVSGVADGFDRELLSVFDALLVVVLGLVLYAMSAREPSRPPGLMDRVQLLAIGSALVLDLMVLGAMVTRIGDLGFTPNRVAALGLNLVLLVNLAGTAWLSTRFLTGRSAFHRLERWQTSYLPVFALWTATVVAILPPLFAFT